MVVRFETFSHSYLLNGKPVFVPSELGRAIGEDVKRRVEEAYVFPDNYYHLRPGGHVAAMHAHRPNGYFCKIDLERFFYSIGRNRVVRALKSAKIDRPEHYGKWSCVRNPYEDPRYSLPYGFVQSPLLATLVLAQSELGAFLSSIGQKVTVSVYVDDICLSSNDRALLDTAFGGLLAAAGTAGFSVSEAKVMPPVSALEIFHCDLRQNYSMVTGHRIAEFEQIERSTAGQAAFARYVASVQDGNMLSVDAKS